MLFRSVSQSRYDWYRKLLNLIVAERRKGHSVTVILINQWRDKIGQVFGDPRTYAGGRWPRHGPLVTIECKNKQLVDKNDEIQRNEHSFVLTKCKSGMAMTTGKFYISRNNSCGFPIGSIIDFSTIVSFLVKIGIISGGGKGGYRIGGYKERFSTYKEIENYFFMNKKYCSFFRAYSIMRKRVEMGLSPLPEDGDRKSVV